MAKESSSTSFFDSSKSQLGVMTDKDCACVWKSVDDEKKKFERSDEEYEVTEQSDIKKSLWETIIQESKENAALYENWRRERDGILLTKNYHSTVDYLESEIFPTLLIAIEKTLHKARALNVLEVQKCRFNGLDYLAEYLWNKNSRWPMRNEWLEINDIPQFKLCLRLHPRPIFPKSWLWSDNEAASYIQRYVRGWLVRKREDVQEMRQFWKAIKDDKESLNHSDDSAESRIFDICERYKLLAKKREKPF